MNDFFESQESARKKTTLLVVLFSVAVILIVISVYVALSALYYITLVYRDGMNVSFSLWNPARFVVLCTITLLVIIFGSIFKISQLKGGGYRVAELLGGRPLTRNTNDPAERKLLNVVEEMAIASGVPVPSVYVMDRERGINAFAAGYGMDDAVVCVTRGSLELLNRDELQGVVAHEFSHIFNGDMLMNIRLMGWLHGILLLSLSGEGLLRSLKYVRGRGAAAFALLGVALYILGSIGMFFGKLIKSALSRQREFLADASAVQFTRNPAGLAGALKKIGGLALGSRIVSPRVSEASHMYFCNGISESLTSLMATHPPLLERILLLDPHFDGIFPLVKVPAVEEPPARRPLRRVPLEGVPKVVSGAMAVAILETIGAPMKEHAEMARELLSELPEPVRMSTREPLGACALIYVLLLDPKEEVRARQIGLLREFARPGILAEAETIAGYLPSIAPRLRLPLVDMSFPALRQLSREQYKLFKKNVKRLIEEDHKVSLFECVLGRILIRRLDSHFFGPRKRPAQIYGLRGVAPECSIVLSLLARTGHRDEEEAARAFMHGRKMLGEPRVDIDLLPAEKCSVEEFDGSLDKLAVASPLIKRKLLAACLECLTFDKTIRIEEAELFRAIGEALGVPIPPWLLFREEQS